MNLANTTVMLSDPDGVNHVFEVGEPLPAWACDLIDPTHIAGDPDPEPEPEAADPPPAAAPAPLEPVKPEEAELPTEDEIGVENATQPAEDEPTVSGSRVDWDAFARSKGATEEDLEGKTRNQIRAAYGS